MKFSISTFTSFFTPLIAVQGWQKSGGHPDVAILLVKWRCWWWRWRDRRAPTSRCSGSGWRRDVVQNGKMRHGLMYAETCRGEPAGRFWMCEWDSDVTASSTCGEFELHIVTVRTMGKMTNARSIVIPAHRVWVKVAGEQRSGCRSLHSWLFYQKRWSRHQDLAGRQRPDSTGLKLGSF